MPFPDLRAYLATREQLGEVVHVKEPVDPVLEAPAIMDLYSKGGPIVIFENPVGAGVPLVINLFNSRARMAAILGDKDPEAVGAAITELLKQRPPKGIKEGFEMLSRLKEMMAFFPKEVTKSPVHAVERKEDDIDLARYPITQSWPKDAGRFITLPIVVTRSPVDGTHNYGMYRMQVLGRDRTAMHWQIHKTGAQHWREAQELGQDLECAVVLGADPTVMLAGALPLPPALPEMAFTGFLRGEPVELVQGRTVDLRYPASAEIVLEGRVTGEMVTEGPFGDHTGYYSHADAYPVFEIEAVYERERPLFPATLVGPPPKEDQHIGKAIERMFMPMVKAILPEVRDINLPVAGGFHNLALVSMKKAYPGHPRKVMMALWGLGQLMLTKTIVVVDDWVDVQDPAQVTWVALACFDPQRDTLVIPATPTDSLDHAPNVQDLGSKLGMDCTAKGPAEGYTRPWPAVARMDPAITERVKARWGELGLPPLE